jgi:chromosome segregation protein
MRLERLEIHGFKSFSDRSELAFDCGVTAIVGPNGCGKSNVADAITWVMGEQSARSLRGDRMEDVIFNGSDARKPTASAEVRLRLAGVLKEVTAPVFPGGPGAVLGDGHGNGNGHGNGHGNGNGTAHATPGNGNGNGNGNGHDAWHLSVGDESSQAADLVGEELIRSVAREVEVTRRLYRSGESEYLIDGRVCRLRDVHDLLMDTGLGAKAYAIIEQGKIGMILSSRPADRRQLIEEAAGITKYKARRRAAELKLEAAQQNLTRVEDIVAEVEKQRGTLKRQAAKARRYQRLRDELRRWEKVLFARKHGDLVETIASARARLAEAREGETLAAARVAAVETDLGRVRIELAEADSRATATRESAHALELAINRRQQQLSFDGEQIQMLEERGTSVAAEIETLAARREPAREAVSARRHAVGEADAERDRAEAAQRLESAAYEDALHRIEGFESDVEAARSEVFSAINAATALQHATEHAAAARDRVAGTLSKLDVEASDLRIEAERVAAERAGAVDRLRAAQEAIGTTRAMRAARESELASARLEHEWRARTLREREQELARLEARLKSLEELEAARAGYGDAARMILAQFDPHISQQGAIADYLEVDPAHERAVDSCLGDLLEHVVVERPESAAAGLELVRSRGAGRCGFLIASSAASTDAREDACSPSGPADACAAGPQLPDGVVLLSSVVGVSGPFAGAIRRALGDAWLVPSYAEAAGLSGGTTLPVATSQGDVFRGRHLVSGGGVHHTRGILVTKREIRRLRDRTQTEREAIARLAAEVDGLEAAIAREVAAVEALRVEHHDQEKTVLACDLQLQRASEETSRLEQRAEQLARERRQAIEEREALELRQQEVGASIVRLQADQRAAEERLTAAQRRLLEARDAAEELNQRAADARAVHAAMAERATALASDVERLEEAAADLESRATALASELEHTRCRARELREGTIRETACLDGDIRALEALRLEVHAASDAAAERRGEVDRLELAIRDGRAQLDTIRGKVAELDLTRATAESELLHLAQSCLDTVQASIDEVVAEVARLETDGALVSDARLVAADEPEEQEDELGAGAPFDGGEPASGCSEGLMSEVQHGTLDAEEAIQLLREKIERLGLVNMIAIEQFDELETRHAFLTSQRKDLVDSIAQTVEAIRRIDRTTRQRFDEAFAAINHNFQEMFNALFGGGRAGLALLEGDPLESGIEIIAQPPGKRLQSVQLLSGGEKALTAIALMFAMFKYRPSPFCVLDEIDAPLDDANIGRFVEMLRGMQSHTQFIVITHNRKTMEIANRLYGITMEEPGVSKLISVQLN